MKKVIAIVLGVVLLLSICACSKEETTQQPGHQYAGGWQTLNNNAVILLPSGNAICNIQSCNLSDIAADPDSYLMEDTAATWEYVDEYIIVSYYRDGNGKVCVYKIIDEHTIEHDGEIYSKQW